MDDTVLVTITGPRVVIGKTKYETGDTALLSANLASDLVEMGMATLVAEDG